MFIFTHSLIKGKKARVLVQHLEILLLMRIFTRRNEKKQGTILFIKGLISSSFFILHIPAKINIRTLVVFLSAHTKVRRKTQLRFAALFLADPTLEDGQISRNVAEVIQEGHRLYQEGLRLSSSKTLSLYFQNILFQNIKHLC